MQTRGLLAAPEGSPVLSVLFANRSATLFKMSRFSDCVSDIEEALRFGYPDNLHYKVAERLNMDRWQREEEESVMLKCDLMQVLERKAKALQQLGDNCEDEVDQMNQLIQKVIFKIKLF